MTDEPEVPRWRTERLGDALAALGRALGAPVARVPDAPADLGRGDNAHPEVARWLRAASATAGLDSAPVDVRASSVAALGRSGEAVLLALADGRREFVALMGLPRDGQVGVLGPDEEVRWLPASAVTRLVLGDAGPAVRVEQLCDQLRVRTRARASVAEALRGRQQARPMRGWSLAPARARFSARLREAGGMALAGRAVVARVLQYVLSLAAWLLIGRGALDGRLEPGWLTAWGLMLLSVVGCLAVAGWASGKLAVQLGGLTRERLVEGIFRLSPEEVRTRGVGQLLGAVLETETLEALARTGGPQAVMVVVQIAAGAVVLGVGAAPALNLAALALWLAVTAALGLRYQRRLSEWADARLALTHDLVENMVGHRTLVAQRGSDIPLPEEGFALYERRAAALDRAAALLFTLTPRGWLLVGLGALSPGFIAGSAAPDALAVSLGGMLLIYWALRQLVEVIPGLGTAALAWRRLRPLLAEPAPDRATRAVVGTATDDAATESRGLLVARDVTFQYPGRSEPALHGCTFAIRRGERILVTGGSGSGKSTLGSMLAGLRQPSSGALLLGGFDHHSLGLQRWRERSGGVPQFHENHILSAPLVFNLAMGRGWPPTYADWMEIERLCKELDLGPLLERMPAGLQQMVGDSGWQLSHGERSRVYVARSLLQDLDVRILDESFAALDPETFEKVLDCVLRRTRTLVVVAHL